MLIQMKIINTFFTKYNLKENKQTMIKFKLYIYLIIGIILFGSSLVLAGSNNQEEINEERYKGSGDRLQDYDKDSYTY